MADHEDDNNVVDGDGDVMAEEFASETVKKLRERLKVCQKEKEEYLTGWQRAKADLINARKRDEEDKKEFIKFANERLFDDLIPILDSFDIAMGNKEAWEKVDKGWRGGVEYLYKELVKVMETHGLKQFVPQIGEKFDSLRHETIGTLETDDSSKDHTVAHVVKNGYILGEGVCRPAQVKIFEFKPDSKD